MKEKLQTNTEDTSIHLEDLSDSPEYYLPGILSKRQINFLIQEGYLVNIDSLKEGDDESSFDLHIGSKGWELINGSVKPWGKRFDNILKNNAFSKEIRPDEFGVFKIEKGKTYIFEIKEKLGVQMKKSRFWGMATAKSSIGRMDVIARLIVDGGYEYETLNPNNILTGNMYIEVSPITFNVYVKEGKPITQIRLFADDPKLSLLPSSVSRLILIGSEHNDGTLSVDLSNIDIKGASAAALKSKNVTDTLPLWELDESEGIPYLGSKPSPNQFWERIKSQSVTGRNRLKIDLNQFYILRSKEKIAIPKGVAVYCRAMDEMLGEMRIHYAGFVHPWFGYFKKDDTIGTPLIFEVRGHNVSVNLLHGEKLARLEFYRMSEDAALPAKSVIKESEADKRNSGDYNNQILNLSKFFKEWE